MERNQIFQTIEDRIRTGGTFHIPLNVAKVISNPVLRPPWGGAANISARAMRNLVKKCVESRDYLIEPWQETEEFGRGSFSVDPIVHARRIAWFMRCYWTDEITYDFGVPSHGRYPTYPVLDGNHRLYAAIMRNDEVIYAGYDGSVEAGIEMIRCAFEEVEGAESPAPRF